MVAIITNTNQVTTAVSNLPNISIVCTHMPCPAHPSCVALNIQSKTRRRKITPTSTSPLTIPIKRRGIPAKYKQTPVSRSKVTFTRCHFTLTPSATFCINAIVVTQGRAPDVPGLLFDIILKRWLCARVSHSLLHTLTKMYR